MTAFVILISIGFFIREILRFVLIWISEAKQITLSTEDLKIQAISQIPIEILLMKRNLIEFCSFQTWFKRVFFVNEKLWELLDTEQKEALLVWGYSSQIHASIFTRLIKQNLISPIDRDSLIQGAQLKALLSAMTVVEGFRNQYPPSPFGHILSGLSFTGPSLLEPWQSIKDREAKLLRYLADWGKAG